MLVLSRKQQQQIKIGEQITVTVLRVKGNTVRIGVQAPRDVRVIRGELPKNVSVEEVISEIELTETPDETIVEEIAVEETIIEQTTIEESVSIPTQPTTPGAGLPLARIRRRHGAAPLKQIVASCAALAR